MSFIISAYPNIKSGNFFKMKRLYDPILCRKNIFLYSSGRAALYHAVKAAELPKDSQFLVPSFHCGVETESIKRAGYQVGFYRIKKSLEIDFIDLEKRVNHMTRALIVIHYFGFPQQMENVLNFCKKNKLVLFEDCAHSLYSSYNDKWVGSLGDFGIYSLRKTIGLPNGGGLLCNNKEFITPEDGVKYIDNQLLKNTAKSMLINMADKKTILGNLSREILYLYSQTQVNPSEKNISVSPEPPLPWHYDVKFCGYSNAISSISKPLLRKEDYREIIRKRREHYRLIDHKLHNFRYCLKPSRALEDGVCPLFYVVHVDNRDEIVSQLRNRGIYPFVFGASPHPSMDLREFPNLEYLSKKLLGLPVHQQLSNKDIEIISDEFIVLMNSIMH